MPPNDTTPPSTPKKNKLQLPLDWRLLALLLLVVIGVMLFLWKPWQSQVKASDRTITVTGDSTITAAPDEYIFTPTYDFKSTDKQTALSDMTKKSDEIVIKLKALGVADSKIKTNSSGYNNGSYFPTVEPNGTTTYNLDITVTVNDRALAQKVQDYLVSTSPTGEVSPQVDFSEAKTKQLQGQGRDQATKDARSKADQSAKNLGFKIAGVKSVNDSSGAGGFPRCMGGMICPLSSTVNGAADAASPSLNVQPGENKLDYSVTVVYYIH
jgi:uncharacterized protein YggE